MALTDKILDFDYVSWLVYLFVCLKVFFFFFMVGIVEGHYLEFGCHHIEEVNLNSHN